MGLQDPCRYIWLHLREDCNAQPAYSGTVRRFLFALLAALALSPSLAQARFFTQPELDALVAPIALYPDGLISDVLVASTRPDQVMATARLRKDEPPEESWDPSVKSLLGFPEVLSRMAGSPQWMRDLGDAFHEQEQHVMDTVQSLRKRAQANGNLQSTDQTVVSTQDRAIVVQPRNPEVVYVPYYDPYVVYGPWWWPVYRPVVWAPWPVFVSTGFFFTRADWHARKVVVVNRGPAYVHRHVVVTRPPAHFDHRGPKRLEGKPVVRDYTRVPESQRQPIINSGPRLRSENQNRPQHSMPAAPRFSDSGRPSPRGGGEIRGRGEMRGGGGHQSRSGGGRRG
jgi:hypothetical protein